jgi:hypothetical protein
LQKIRIAKSTKKSFFFALIGRIAISNTSEQSSAFNHEYGSWAAEPKARTPNVQVQIRQALVANIQKVF